MDFGKQNCDISFESEAHSMVLKLLLKFITGFNTVLGLSELIANLTDGQEKL